jgi:serine/threonine-protein kinase HipA
MNAILTYVDIDGNAQLAGMTYPNLRRSKLSSTFAYDSEYLLTPSAYNIDPTMQFSTGIWAFPNGFAGALKDASPDRWGRNLIAKHIQAEARQQGEIPPLVTELDYLLGASDFTRQGALRFKTEVSGKFLDAASSVPKLIALPRLKQSAHQVSLQAAAEASSRTRANTEFAAIKELLDAGTGSLGGARPKASVQDGNNLMIAKFSHPNDKWDVMAWEHIALELAREAGIDTPGHELLDLDGANVLLLKRFDRQQEARLGYMSAMTLIGAEEGQASDYLDIAFALQTLGAAPTADLQQLWRRIAFTICIHNSDDHLRNTGFLWSKAGWRLAPAFDLNPNPAVNARRVTAIGGANDRETSIASLLAYTEDFALSQTEASKVLGEVQEACSGWRTIASRANVSKNEQSRFAVVFDDLTR